MLRENFYIKRKCWYLEKICIFRQNRRFKLQIIYDSGISVYFDQCLYQTKDLFEDQRVYSLKNWLSRLVEELQNITLKDTITYKESIRGTLNKLQYLKVANCERRQHVAPLENLFNVFCPDLSRQFGSSDPRVAVFRSLSFTWNAIPDMLLISRWTLRRRVLEYAEAAVQRCS